MNPTRGLSAGPKVLSLLLFTLSVLTSLTFAGGSGTVVFSEIMYHPAENEPTHEWVELYNLNAVDVDLSGWQITHGIYYAFPNGTTLGGGRTLVIALSPATLIQETKRASILGPFTGRLSNSGEVLELRDLAGRLMDRVNYDVDGDWPVGPDGGGVSLAKHRPELASDLAGSWAPSSQLGGTPGVPNFDDSPLTRPSTPQLGLTAEWRYLDDGSDPGSGWKLSDFDDRLWKSGPGAFWRGDITAPTPAGTALAASNTTAYFRTSWAVSGNPSTRTWSLRTWIDDGAVISLNGVEAARVNMRTGAVSHATQAASTIATPTLSDPFLIDSQRLIEGTNWISVELHAHSGLTNSGLRVLPATSVRVLWDGRDGDYFSAASPASTPANEGLSVSGTLAVGSSNTNLSGKVNDGSYGSASSWIPLMSDASPFMILTFGRRLAVTNVAWSRNNSDLADNACDGSCLDSALGSYILQYTLSTNPVRVTSTGTNPTNAWATLATIHYLGLQPGFTPHRRHRFSLSTAGGDPIQATGIRIRLPSGAALDEVEVNTPALNSFDAAFSLELSSAPILPPAPSLRFNEVSAGSPSPFWIELINAGGTPVDLTGIQIRRNGGSPNTYVLPSGTLAPGGLKHFTESELPFTAADNQKLFLYSSGASLLLDAVSVRTRVRGNSPDGSGFWQYPVQPTPGDFNRFELHRDVVIHEILHRAPPNLPPLGEGSDEEWIELHNRSSHSMDLGGWRIEGGIDYLLPAGTTLPSQGFMVIAKQAAALRQKWPEIQSPMLGDFTGKLSVGERLRLKDAAGNLANEVTILSGEWSEGGGSSLELIDPRSDNTQRSAWADSEESQHNGWQAVKYSMISRQRFGSSDWNEFRIGMLEAGECLIDDLSVVRDPSGARQQLIQNGDFEVSTGATRWRALGNHDQSQLIPEPGNAANHVLKVTSSGPARTSHNHIESSFLGNTRLIDGREYEVSFRVRWLRGSSLLHTSAYFQRLARVTHLLLPSRLGTPGAANSRRLANAGPTLSALAHFPLMPRTNQPVTLTIQATDPDGVRSATLYYRINPATNFTPVAMAQEQENVWRGTIPGSGAGSIVQFYVRAEDELSAARSEPQGAETSRALYQVMDSQATRWPAHEFRLIQLNSDRDALLRSTNLMSQQRLGGTVLYRGKEVFYDVGVRLHGSAAGRARDGEDYISYDIEFPPDQLFRGTHRHVGIDRSGRAPNARQQDEIYVLHMFHRAGLPCHRVDLGYFIAPRTSHTGPVLLQLGAYDGLFVEQQFGQDGSVFNLDLTYEPSTTLNGNYESLKLPVPLQAHIGTDFTDLGEDREQYRAPFSLRLNEWADDFSSIIRLCKTMGAAQSRFNSEIPLALDVDQAERLAALTILCGIGDTYFSSTPSLPHNFRIFAPSDGGPIVFLPWDMDFVFTQSGDSPIFPTPDINLSKLMNFPATRRNYLWHVNDLCRGAFSAGYLTPWLSHYAGTVGQDYTAAAVYIQSRRAFALRLLPAQVTFAITNFAGADFDVDATHVRLEGKAWINIRELKLAGENKSLEVTWKDLTTWQVTLPVSLGPNRFSVLALGAGTNLVGSDQITITRVDSTTDQDADGDGIPDLWEQSNGTQAQTADAGADPDGDGSNNLQEYWAGTDPRDRTSTLRLSAKRTLEGAQLDFQAVAGRAYTLLHRPDLREGEWIVLAEVPVERDDRPIVFSFVHPLGPSHEYFRLNVSKP